MVEETEVDGIRNRSSLPEPGLATDDFYACIRENARRAQVKKMPEEQRRLMAEFPILGESISSLALKTATFNRLQEAGIETLYDLLQKNRSQLLKITNLGEIGVTSIFLALEEKGFRRV